MIGHCLASVLLDSICLFFLIYKFLKVSWYSYAYAMHELKFNSFVPAPCKVTAVTTVTDVELLNLLFSLPLSQKPFVNQCPSHCYGLYITGNLIAVRCSANSF